jgi:hypothetical protein
MCSLAHSRIDVCPYPLPSPSLNFNIRRIHACRKFLFSHTSPHSPHSPHSPLPTSQSVHPKNSLIQWTFPTHAIDACAACISICEHGFWSFGRFEMSISWHKPYSHALACGSCIAICAACCRSMRRIRDKILSMRRIYTFFMVNFIRHAPHAKSNEIR